MKDRYEEVRMEVVEFEVEDVITASGKPGSPIDLPIMPGEVAPRA